jgi:hypothetical protein
MTVRNKETGGTAGKAAPPVLLFAEVGFAHCGFFFGHQSKVCGHLLAFLGAEQVPRDSSAIFASLIRDAG